MKTRRRERRSKVNKDIIEVQKKECGKNKEIKLRIQVKVQETKSHEKKTSDEN